MDSDDDQPGMAACGQREKELNKLRSGSTSPSTLSTASSGSPLVRGHSGSSSGKRPAPTSIAAAQLQCQQSQLDFSARLLSSKDQAKQQAKLSKKGSKSQQCGTSATSSDHHKSFGYRLAKSAAFRAYRVNELWSMNKIRYMNLACLLMTLICLVAIVLLAGRSQQQVPKHDYPQHRDHLSSRRLNGDESLAESIESLDSQPLVIGGTGSGSGFAHDSPRGTSKWARSYPSTGEREVEETTTSTTTTTTTTSTSPRPSHTINEQRPSISSDSFGIEPLLNRLFNDLELGPSSLLDLLKKNSSKPIVKRTKNGATIIISASSSSTPFNDSSLSASSMVPSLFGKMLPPFFRHNIRQLPFSGLSPLADLNSFGTPLSSESRISMTSSGMPLGTARFSSFFGPMNPFMSPIMGAGLSQRTQSLFMEPPMLPPFSMRQDFGMNPLGMGPSMMTVSAMPPPGLLNMLLRAQHQDDDTTEEEEETGNNQQSSQQAASTQLKNDTLTSTNTSQQQQQQQHNSSQPQPEASEQVVDTVTGRSRVHLPRAKLTGSSGPMLVFSAGSMGSPEADQPSFMSAFGPPGIAGQASQSGFMPMVPQFVVFNGESAERNPISPMLKSLLGGLMSELGGVGHQQQEHMMHSTGNNKQSTLTNSSSTSNERPTSASGPSPAWAELNPDDDWMPASETSLDEQTTSKHLRAHHKNLESELNLEPADFLSDLDNIEKQILRTNQLSPLGPHTRSQSLSRLDSVPTPPFIEAAEPTGRLEHVVKAYRSPIGGNPDAGASIFLKPAMERMDSVDIPPPHLSFIGRLLSELSRKPDHVITSGSGQQPMARGFAPRSASMLSSGNLGELEESDDSTEDTVSMFQPMVPMPSKRVRVRIRPLASPHEPVPVAIPSVMGTEDRIRNLGGKSGVEASSQERGETLKPNARTSDMDHATQSSEARLKHVILSEHPFTSPSSPLFGFPAHSASVGARATETGNKQHIPINQQVAPAVMGRSSEVGGNRQQRSFTYHSNHEVAGSMVGPRQQVPPSHHPAPLHQIEGRSREGAVLGRRLDDSPTFERPIKLSQSGGTHQQQPDLPV